VAKIINSIPEFGVRPEGMAIDPERNLYYKQYDIDNEFENFVKPGQEAVRLKVNLYFAPIRRCNEPMELEKSIQNQKNELEYLFRNQTIVSKDTIKRNYSYYKLILDQDKNLIKSFELNDNKVSKSKNHSGFFQ
jgi:hypothetical protein